MSLIGKMAPGGNLKPSVFISRLHNFLPPPSVVGVSGGVGGLMDECEAKNKTHC